MKSRKALFLAVFGLLVFVTYAYGFLTSVTRIPSVGTVKTVAIEAYWDINCTSKVTEINWGLLEPGETSTVTIYLMNQGNAPVTLSMSTENWDPTNASDYVTLQWSYRGETVNTGETIEASLALTVNATITGITSFRFDIIIAGSG